MGEGRRFYHKDHKDRKTGERGTADGTGYFIHRSTTRPPLTPSGSLRIFTDSLRATLSGSTVEGAKFLAAGVGEFPEGVESAAFADLVDFFEGAVRGEVSVDDEVGNTFGVSDNLF